MSKVAQGVVPSPSRVASPVRVVRGEQVLLDADVAALYEVETKALNQAVKRNAERFPADFMFRLTVHEWGTMRSQDVTASRRNVGAPPLAFTQNGIGMLSGVLRSPRAIEVNIAIIRTFVQLRRLMGSNRDLDRKIRAMESRYDEQFAAVFEAIKRLVAEDAVRKSQPKRPIGFHS